MEEELYINNVRVDLKSATVSRTLQINDFAELEDRQANYSNSIKIPRTSKNIKIFNFLGVNGNKTRTPYVNVSVKYVVGGIELVSDGKGVISGTDTNYNLVIYDGNIDIADILEDLTLEDLDFTDYNHNLTTDVWLNSFVKTSGYIYGIGKYYEEANTRAFNIDLQNVSFYIHTLVQMIFEQQGLTLSGDIFSNEDYLSRVMSMSTGYDRTSYDDTTQVYSNTNESFTNELFSSSTTKQYLFDSYTSTSSNVHTINIEGTATLIIGSDFYYVFKVNGNEVLRTEIDSGEDLDFDTSIQLINGDVLNVYVECTSYDNGLGEEISFDSRYTTIYYENAIYIPIDFNDLIGDISQINLVKDVMQRFGLIFRKVRNKDEYEFIQMKVLLNDIDNAENWSDKYSAFKSESYLPSYAQTNVIEYSYDDDDEDEDQTFANGEFYIDNVNLDDEETLFTTIFKASTTDDSLYQLYHWDGDPDEIEAADDDNRIFKINRVNDTINFKFNDDVENYKSYNTTVAYLDFASLYYQNELDNNYVEVNSMLNDYKFITLYLDLNVIDIYNLDFFKLKTFEQIAGYYYLNKVKSFKSNSLTQVELIRIGDVTAFNVPMSAEINGEATTTATLTYLDEGEMSAQMLGYAEVSATLRSTTISSVQMSSSSNDEAFVCSASVDTTYYFNGNQSEPIVGDTIYTDSAGTTILNGLSLYWKLDSGNYIQIDSLGIVLSKSSC